MLNDNGVISSGVSDDDEAQARTDALKDLVGEWLTLAEVGALTGRSLNQCRRMVSDHEVLAARVGPGGPRVPAGFFADGEPLPALKGTITVLLDGGMDDVEAITWLFTPDPTLPAAGHPVDNLVAGFKTEVRRRAMELAF